MHNNSPDEVVFPPHAYISCVPAKQLRSRHLTHPPIQTSCSQCRQPCLTDESALKKAARLASSATCICQTCLRQNAEVKGISVHNRPKYLRTFASTPRGNGEPWLDPLTNIVRYTCDGLTDDGLDYQRCDQLRLIEAEYSLSAIIVGRQDHLDMILGNEEIA
jgi:hypothetical protein